MPYIQFNDQQFPLGSADLTVGAFDGAGARLPGSDPKAWAVLKLGADGTAFISKGSADAEILINGVRLGSEPSPVLHGDRVEVGGHELRFGSDDALGVQTVVPSVDQEASRSKMGTARQPTAATGGRLVSMVDGREYLIFEAGVTIGRDIGCDVVVASGSVSRNHAQIAPAEGGYVVTDLSTNGVLVNGTRVDRTRVLGRLDVVRIGPEEFRFYADPVRLPRRDPSLSAPSLSDTGYMPVVPPPARHPSAPATADPPPMPAVPMDRHPVATLEITNEGPTKGKIFEIYGPLTNVGRGSHNDIVVNDESLSVSHAKIFRRDGLWWLMDQASTNGTYIGGRRVLGEQQLVGAPDVRFGGIKMIFHAAQSAGEDEVKGTRAIAAFHVDAAKKLSEQQRAAAAAAAAPGETKATPVEQKKGCASMVAFIVSLAAIGATAAITLIWSRG